MCRSLNSHFLKQYDKSDTVDTVENIKVQINSIENDFESINNMSLTNYELNESKTILRSELF